MPKENIEGFDFTKDFKPQDIYEMLKEDILTACGESVGMQVNEEIVKCGTKDIALAYEANDKLYSAVKLQIIVKVSNHIWKDFILTVTPFNCYWNRYSDGYAPSDNNKNVDLTKKFRSNMKGKYGKVYTDAKEAFIKEIKDIRVQREADLYYFRVKLINQKYTEDLNV